MRQHFILTASGQDRPGVLEEFTALLLQYDGNVEASRMAHLGSAFAILMLVSAPSERLDELRAAVAALREGQFLVQTLPTEIDTIQPASRRYPCGITVTGADNLGIMHDIARYLASVDVNVETLNTEIMSAPMSGTPLFALTAVVTVPEEMALDELRSGMERLAAELGVDAAVLDYGA
jgi:glycine cleavage system transcriptional repressor